MIVVYVVLMLTMLEALRLPHKTSVVSRVHAPAAFFLLQRTSKNRIPVLRAQPAI